MSKKVDAKSRTASARQLGNISILLEKTYSYFKAFKNDRNGFQTKLAFESTLNMFQWNGYTEMIQNRKLRKMKNDDVNLELKSGY